MLVPVYMVTLGISAGLAGAYARRLLAAVGVVSGFENGVIVAAGVFFLFAASQLAYMAFIQAVVPARGHGPLVSEMLSHAGAVLLIPYLANVSVEWPLALLEKVEPALYLGAFAAVHLFFKLMTLYSACRARAAGRLGALAWAGAGALCLLGAYSAYGLWSDPDSRAPLRELISSNSQVIGP